MDVASKVYITVGISSAYILFQAIIVALLNSHGKPNTTTDKISREEIWYIRIHQMVVALITLIAAALQSWLFRTLAYPRGINVAVALVLFSLSVLLVFSGQCRIRQMRSTADEQLSTVDPMHLSAAFAVLVSCMYLAVSIAQSVSA